MEKLNGFHSLYHTGRRRSRRFVSKRGVAAVRFWRSLTFSQRCYFIASCMLLVWMYSDFESKIYDIVMYAFVLSGITKEVWPRFMIIWHSLPGKAFILFTYAVIANFALASASGMVNDVSGVSAGALPYSHNFALILMMPTWFFLTSIFALVIVTLLTPVYLMTLLALKPIGVRRFWHAPEYRFVFTTALVRYIWTLALLWELILLAAQVGLVGSMGDEKASTDALSFERASQAITSEIVKAGTKTGNVPSNAPPEMLTAPQVDEVNIPLIVDNVLAANNVKPKSTQEADIKATIEDINTASDDLEAEIDALWKGAKDKNIAFKRSQRRLLANFIYEFEADSRSRCAHSPDTRVIELNDYELLEISKDDSEENELGYNYVVVACQSAAIGNKSTGSQSSEAQNAEP